jgi:hypothetical protein
VITEIAKRVKRPDVGLFIQVNTTEEDHKGGCSPSDLAQLVKQAMDAGLYSRYAMQDFQEFWAESVEIFFEKPLDLFKKYPNLYYAMRNILNQDTVLA